MSFTIENSKKSAIVAVFPAKKIVFASFSAK